MFAGLARFAEQRVADGRGPDGLTSLVEAIKRPAPAPETPGTPQEEA